MGKPIDWTNEEEVARIELRDVLWEVDFWGKELGRLSRSMADTRNLVKQLTAGKGLSLDLLGLKLRDLNDAFRVVKDFHQSRPSPHPVELLLNAVGALLKTAEKLGLVDEPYGHES